MVVVVPVVPVVPVAPVVPVIAPVVEGNERFLGSVGLVAGAGDLLFHFLDALLNRRRRRRGRGGGIAGRRYQRRRGDTPAAARPFQRVREPFLGPRFQIILHE